MVSPEQELTGGNASGRVVRIGNTVRKPWLEKSADVQDYLTVLRSSGVDVPQTLGRDDDGRSVFEYVDGVLALEELPLPGDDLRRVGLIVRGIHDASEAFEPVEDAAARLRAVVDGYQADDTLRRALPAASVCLGAGPRLGSCDGPTRHSGRLLPLLLAGRSG